MMEGAWIIFLLHPDLSLQLLFQQPLVLILTVLNLQVLNQLYCVLYLNYSLSLSQQKGNNVLESGITLAEGNCYI